MDLLKPNQNQITMGRVQILKEKEKNQPNGGFLFIEGMS